MNNLTGTQEFFTGIDKIKFEGKESRNPMAFRYYDAERIVMGKPMKDWTRFASIEADALRSKKFIDLAAPLK